MILILSTPHDDDTNLVIEHLSNLKEKFIRINDLDIFTGKTKFDFKLLDTIELTVENPFFGKRDLSEVTCVWYRKFGFFEKYKHLLENVKNDEALRFLESEHRSTLEMFFHFLRGKKWLNNYFHVRDNSKISILNYAIRVGLDIPYTHITNYSSENSINPAHSYITKPIKDGSVVNAEDKIYFFLTKKIEYSEIIENTSFFPSLFQKNIQKEYELRVFHLNGKNYPMAIFSQNDEQTETDFRQYNYQKPNRMIPYQLPAEIDNKINKLMKAIKLETGSIDLIKGCDGKYYFLEVNPSGQFRMTSFPCNYNLHFEVAQYLQRLNKK
ncbi:grasp-with-spasm system ATP-grasp peptide maturase [Chryseobacterium sp. CT-SW4]|uniref:grasp-with-spasm system ATP-grasp peptide maturase n=1 Tax=Chryseobacterium sp. SW-1 TaxID=3157343 RepID=UPI003B0122EA